MYIYINEMKHVSDTTIAEIESIAATVQHVLAV